MLRHRTVILVSVLVVGVALAAPAVAATTDGKPSGSGAKRTVTHPDVNASTLSQRLLSEGRSLPATTGPETVVLALRPRNFTLLEATAAAARTLPVAVREARRAAAVAGTGRAKLVAAAARRLGLTVLSTSDMSVIVQGSSTLIHQDFGSARDTDPDSAVAQPLPRMPASISPWVMEAGGGDDTRPAELPTVSSAANVSDTGLSASTLRGMYDIPTTSAPPTAGSPTIATLQFSGWNENDLQSYIDANGDRIYGSNTSDYSLGTAFTADDVLPDAQTSTDGSSEVALDQETLATVAPQLRQRAYFAPDGNVDGEYAELDAVAQQAATYHIMAVSTSWGLCEPENYGQWFADESDPVLLLDETAVFNVLASGVTMFAASGDSGATDCDYTQADGSCTSGPTLTGQPAPPPSNDDFVDTPASIPGVIAVGGTTGTSMTALDTWDTGPCSASGGGFSCMFLLPSYQGNAARVPAVPYGSNYPCYATQGGTEVSARGVPDIAADAGDGLSVYDSDSANCSPCTFVGTSFAAQVAAGAWTQTIVDHGAFARGLGDITTALYSAAVKPSINDVVHGADNTDSDPQYGAKGGWDPVTGLGSPNFNAMVSTIAGSVARAADVDFVQDSGSGSGKVELSGLSVADSFHGFSANVTTPLTVTDPSEWAFAVGPFHNDGHEDLYAIQTSGTTSGRVQVSVLSQISDDTAFLLQNQPTGLAQVPAGQYQFRIASYANDGQGDLFAIRDAGAADTQLFAFSAASGYTQLLVARNTPIAPEPTGWTFLIGNNGDLFAVRATSANVALFDVSNTSDYHDYSLAVLTPLAGTTNPSVSYTLGDVNGDGVPDLSEISTGGSATEIFTLDGADADHAYLEERVTPLATLNPTEWSAVQGS